METILRCKMRVIEVVHSIDSLGQVEQEKVKLCAVTSGSNENKQWAKWTPGANFEIYINNPAAMNKLSKGHEFYIDFVPVNQLEEVGK